MWHCVLCILVCAEFFLPYESSADRRPAKPKPLAYYVESYRDRETDRNIPFSVLLPHLGALQLRQLNALLSGIFTTKQ